MRSLFALLTISAALGAQAPTNLFGIYPDSTSFTTRAQANASTADILVQVHTSDWRGVCQRRIGGQIVGRVTGFQVTIQDQDASTIEWFNHCLIPDDVNNPGNPDTNPASELLRTTNANLPSGVGTVAWSITSTLATPFDGIPLEKTWYLGTQLPANGAWTNDGVSIHAANYVATSAGQAGDNPRTIGNVPPPNLTHTILRPANVLGLPNTKRTMLTYVATEGVVLNPGQDVVAGSIRGVNPAYGVGGLYPDNGGRGDGLAFRLRDAANAGGSAAIFLSVGFFSPPIDLGLNGFLLLNPALLLQIGGGTIGTTGELVTIIAPAGTTFGVIGPLTFQAATAGAAGLAASNAVQTTFE